jgi:hypothetical protein
VFNWMLAPHFLVEFLLSGTIDKFYISLAVDIVNFAPIKAPSCSLRSARCYQLFEMLWRIDMKRRVVMCFADALLMFINSLIEKLSRRRGPEYQLSCKVVGTDPKIDARIFGSAADSNSFSLSSKVSSYSIFPPCPKTTTPPALKVRRTRKTLVPIRPKWPVCINFSLHSNSRCLFKLLCSCLGCPVNDFSVRLSRPNKQFLLH